ncbi:MAG: hypothetical protein BGO26_19115 [Actinobacteria bacterium 69-20]|nr:MAG: hypothetical protein BGO26_19115 [Actinobacteria bacterium 69-20]
MSTLCATSRGRVRYRSDRRPADAGLSTAREFAVASDIGKAEYDAVRRRSGELGRSLIAAHP